MYFRYDEKTSLKLPLLLYLEWILERRVSLRIILRIGLCRIPEKSNWLFIVVHIEMVQPLLLQRRETCRPWCSWGCTPYSLVDYKTYTS